MRSLLSSLELKLKGWEGWSLKLLWQPFNSQFTIQVFDRGLKAIPLSVDLWVHYLNYIKTAYETDPELIRTKYKDAIDACGMEFR
jgi:hypothetical protein